MYHIHVGVKPETAEVIRLVEKMYPAQPGDPIVHIDGDGWNAWGEAPGTDNNDADTLHVVLEVETLTDAIEHVAAMWERHEALGLVPSNTPGVSDYVRRHIIIVTEAEDWSVQHLVVRVPATTEF